MMLVASAGRGFRRQWRMQIRGSDPFPKTQAIIFRNKIITVNTGMAYMVFQQR